MRAFKKSGHRIRIPKDRARIAIVAENLSEVDAFQLEMLLIYLHGRIDNGTGILRNLTDGGEGTSGTIVSSETREKLRISHVGVPWTPARAAYKQSAETIAKRSRSLTGRPVSEETRRKLSAQAGWKHSIESRLKMSRAKIGYVPWNKGKRKEICLLGHTKVEGNHGMICNVCAANRKRKWRSKHKVESK